MFFLPQHSPRESRRSRRWTDIVIAALGGGTVGLLSWLIMTQPATTISEYFTANAKPRGGGDNVVNVILVDFRGLDTLGEITVLAIAAIGIAAMLSRLRLAVRDLDWQGGRWSEDRHPMMLSVIARPLLPLALLVAVYLFLRGHNAPGGGFIAGLVAGAAIILQYIAGGAAAGRALLPLNSTQLMAFGLLCALAIGTASWAFDAPFLTSTYGYITWPIVGRFELASALVFDLGVFLVVLGTVLSILANLGEASDVNLRPHEQLAADAVPPAQVP
jgi:multicomponent K+:H+ antiporter subunit A